MKIWQVSARATPIIRVADVMYARPDNTYPAMNIWAWKQQSRARRVGFLGLRPAPLHAILLEPDDHERADSVEPQRPAPPLLQAGDDWASDEDDVLAAPSPVRSEAGHSTDTASDAEVREAMDILLDPEPDPSVNSARRSSRSSSSTSSSSSSSSSSTSSSSSAEGGDQHLQEPQPAAVEPQSAQRGERNREGDREAREGIAVKNERGETCGHIKHHPGNESFYCECARHPRCIKSRTYRVGRHQGSGRPLGFLSAWCVSSHLFASKQDHMKYRPPFQDRLQARTLLQREWNSEEFLAAERGQLPDEAEPEPREVPA